MIIFILFLKIFLIKKIKIYNYIIYYFIFLERYIKSFLLFFFCYYLELLSHLLFKFWYKFTKKVLKKYRGWIQPKLTLPTHFWTIQPNQPKSNPTTSSSTLSLEKFRLG